MRKTPMMVVVVCLLAASFFAGQASSVTDRTAGASSQGQVVQQLAKLNQTLGKPYGAGRSTAMDFLRATTINTFLTCEATWGQSPAHSAADCEG
jgi:hypothetical protein